MSFLNLKPLLRFLASSESLESKYKRRDIYGNYFYENDSQANCDNDPDVIALENFIAQNYPDEVLFEIKFKLYEVHQSIKVSVTRW